MNTAPEDEGLKQAFNQARAQYDSIVEMVERLRKADDGTDENERDDARQAILEDALSVRVRSDWHNVGEEAAPGEFEILLCTGGPAVRIIGQLDDYHEPRGARLQYQNWFTPWTDWETNQKIEADLLAYAQTFWFGE